MRLSHNILNIEKEFRVFIHLAYVANCISTRHLRKYIMNILYKISYGLFASVLLAAYLENMNATFLLFTTAVVVLVTAVYLNDLKNK
jgi:hypothetical protein